MKAYVGILIAMGIVKCAKIRMYFESIFFFIFLGIRRTMTFKRFQKISKYLHLNDPTKEVPFEKPG